MQVWIGEPGLISLLHYDASHNFFLQLRGHKSFILLPPSEAPKVQLFPWAHPGDAHTQLQLEDHEALERLFDEGAYSDLFTLNASVANLDHGDLLYIPPYWLHQVITWDLGSSASVSFITQSDVQRLMLEVERLPVPVAEGWARDKKRRVTAMMIGLVWRQLRGTSEPPLIDTLAELLRSRYRVWIMDPKPDLTSDPVQCEFWRDEQALADTVEELAAGVAALFLRVPDLGTRKLLFWNYVEAVAVVVSEGIPKEIPRWISEVAGANCSGR